MAVVRRKLGTVRPPPPPLPPAAEDVWAAFHELSSARPSGFGLQAIPWGEIAAYQAVTGIRLTRWEIDLLRDLDRAYLEVFADPAQDKT